MEAKTRREFLAGAGLCAGVIAFGGVEKAFGLNETLLRPPGGQDEAAFIASCLKCDRCRTVCPRDIVTLATVSDGFLSARTPVLNFHVDRCDFCNRCIDVCSTGALTAFDPQTERLGTAVIDTDACYAYLRGTCDLCRNSCEYGALTFDAGNRPVIDAELCNGCGACVAACKINVFTSYSGSEERAIEVRREVGAHA